jgi:outer membrane protein
MTKKFVLLIIAILPLVVMAQNQKIGHVSSQEIIALMPEVDNLNAKMKESQDAWEKELLKMREEYYTKVKSFQDTQATLSESIKQARQAELADMEQRISNLNQTAQDDLAKKQQELAAPILDKVKKAIGDVATENGFSYIIDNSSQILVYAGNNAIDVTPLVKKKLNLKDRPAVQSTATPSTTPAATPTTAPATKK